MSTDDSISEEVSYSAGVSHENVESSGTKESESSIISSEDSPPIQPGADMEKSPAKPVKTVKGFFWSSPELMNSTDPRTAIQHSSNKSRVNAGETLGSERNLPSINPSPIENLTALVKDIQISGDCDPEVWKNCEARWLQLFQLVEKQYQDQILAQHEQYQCQIQLIQDEIKALVLIKKKQNSLHNTEAFAVVPDNSVLLGILNGCHSKPFLRHKQTSIHPSAGEIGRPHNSSDTNPEDSAFAVLLSSGFGTGGPEHSLNKHVDSSNGKNTLKGKHAGHALYPSENLSCPFKSDRVSKGNNSQHELRTAQEKMCNVSPAGSKQTNPNLSVDQRKMKGQLLTSWAQKQKHKSRAVQDTRQEEQAKRNRSPDHHEDIHSCSAVQSPHSFFLGKRNDSPDSLVSEASGLTYWKLDESELYRSLPENLENGSYFYMQDESINPHHTDEPRLPASLKVIYHMKQKGDANIHDRDSYSSQFDPSQSAPQVLTLDPTLHMKPADRDSLFSSPSHFNTASFLEETKPSAAAGDAVSPDSMAEAPSQSHTDTYSISNDSSLSAEQINGTHRLSLQKSALPSKNRSLCSTSPKAVCTNGQHPAFRNGIQNDSLSNTDDEGSCSTLTPPSRIESSLSLHASGARGSDRTISLSSLEDPVVSSLVRQNLREKHSRHVADLRAYYESEIISLEQQLEAVVRPPNSVNMERTNENLQERCDHLERALTEASSRIRDQENMNRLLEKQLVDWPDRYDTASAAAQVLQQRLDEMKHSNKAKDNAMNKLKARLRNLEEAFQNACKVSDDKEVRMRKEHKMLQDLLVEYESLGKEHERVKDTLVSTENKLFDANTQISELKRIISKLEAQIKQLEHENIMKLRHTTPSHSQASGVGLLLNRPEVYRSPSKAPVDLDANRRKLLTPGADYSIFTGQPLENDLYENSSRCYSPPEKDATRRETTVAKEGLKRDPSLTPIMKALIELDGTKATEGRALRKSGASDSRFGSCKPSVSFAETCSRDQLSEKSSSPVQLQRNSSPVGNRSSSLPPHNRKASPVSTPTKRDTMITPVSAKSSPKRCPRENFSPGMSHLLGKHRSSPTRFGVRLDEVDVASASPSHSPSPRKRLQFTSLDEPEVSYHSSNAGLRLDSRTESALKAVKQGAVTSRSAWEDETTAMHTENHAPGLLKPYETELTYKARMESLAQTERIFDELTQEKQQIEATLSRLPGVGGRVTLKAKLDEEALEDRLEKINRDLGSIRMTLKRFHVLRTSANI
ncbi:M-phase phosphoprotein 9-like isoform X2 [Polyodon spathula]|uniref:M-phase phosphoprotein 9-like isoform X2 n=1 Tax=Polyodon spathula TaxID=7913 RepID=UPI001B7EB594|nr:M-phase phosphoprotein 9-like isoform X2 [Polyodon spathula]